MSGGNKTGSAGYLSGSMLENLEARLLLDTVNVGQSVIFVDASNRSVMVTLDDPNGTPSALVTGTTGPALGANDIQDITITGSTPTTILTIITVDPNNQNRPYALHTNGNAAWDYGQDGQPGTGDDIAAPANTGPVRVVGAITSDGPMGRIVIDGLVLGNVTLGGSIGVYYSGDQDGDMLVDGSIGYLQVNTSVGLGDPTSNTPQGGTIEATHGITTISVGGALYKSVFTGASITPAELTTPDAYTEQEILGLTLVNGAVPGLTSNDTQATAEHLAPISGSTTVTGTIEGRVPLPGGGNATDLVDMYDFTLSAGSTVTAHLSIDPTNFGTCYIVLVRPNGTWIDAGFDDISLDPNDPLGIATIETSQDITWKADANGVYTLAVVNYINNSYSLAGSLPLGYEGDYQLTLNGIDAVSLGNLTVGGTIDGTAFPNDVQIAANVGSIGHVSAGSMVWTDISSAGGSVNDVNSPTFRLSSVTASLDIGQVTGGTFTSSSLTAGRDIGNVSMTGAISGATISADRWIGQIHVGGNFNASSVTANADGLGDPGFINLVDVTGNLGSGGSVDFSTGPGGDLRYMRVGGTVWASVGGVTTQRNPVTFDNTSSPDRLRIVDDSGGVLQLAPASGASGSYMTYPVEGGVGVAIINLTVNGNVGMSAIGDVMVGTLDFTPVLATDSLIMGGSGNIGAFSLVETGTGNSIINNTHGPIVAADLGTLTLYSVKTSIGGASFDSGAAGALSGNMANAIAPGPTVIDGLKSSGDLLTVKTDGAVHDLVCGGNLGALIVDADKKTAQGGFDGIEGFIYGANIGTVTVGDGMVKLPTTQKAVVGIYSPGTITNVIADGPNVQILAPIIAQTRVERVSINNGAILNAPVLAVQLNQFAVATLVGSNLTRTGTIGTVAVAGHNSQIYNSLISAIGIDAITGTGGTAGMVLTEVNSDSGGIGKIAIDGPGILNGWITSNMDIGSIAATGPTGAIDTESIYARGSIGKISAFDMNATDVTAEGSTGSVAIKHDLSGGSLRGGALGSLTIGANMEADVALVLPAIEYAGPIKSVVVKGSAVGSIKATGPTAVLGKLSTGGPMNLAVLIEGVANSITTGPGQNMDIDLQVIGPRAAVGKLSSGGYLHGRLIIDGPAKEISSNGELATPGQLIYVNGDVGKIATKGTPGAPPVDIAANIVVNGVLKQLTSNGGVTGNVQASRGIQSFLANGNVSGNVVSNTTIKSMKVLGDLTGNVTATGDVSSIAVTGNTAGDVTSLQGSVLKLAGGGSVSGYVGANLDVVSVVAGGALSGNFEAGRDIKSLKGGSFSGTAVAANNIQSLAVTGLFSGQAQAGIDINTVTAGGDFNGATVAAARNIGSISGGNAAIDSFFLAGFNTGADLVVGGGDDTLTGGNMGGFYVSGDYNNSVVAAGVGPGLDGFFGTGDDAVAPGQSSIGTVLIEGSVVNNPNTFGIFADTAIGSLTIAGAVLTVPTSAGNFHANTVQGTVVAPGGSFILPSGIPLVLTDTDGDIVTLLLTGPGGGTIDTDTGTLTANRITDIQLAGTNAAGTVLSITVTQSGGGDGLFSADLIEAGDDTGLKSLLAPAVTINGSAGQGISIDGSVGTLTVYSLADNADVNVGGNLGMMSSTSQGTVNVTVGGAAGNVQVGPWAGGSFTTRELGSLSVSGNMAASTGVTASTLKTKIAVTGNLTGDVYAATGLDTLAVTGNIANDVVQTYGPLGKLLVGGSMNASSVSSTQGIASATLGGMNAATLAAAGNLGTVKVVNDVVDSLVMSGYGLGADGQFGGGDDYLSSGSMKSVTVGGNVDTSCFTAGVGAGADGLFGTTDDTATEDYSSIDSLAIAGTVTATAQSGILAASNLGKITNAKAALGSFGLLTVAVRPNASGAPRVELVQQAGPRVVITFSEDMLPETLTTATVSLVPSGGPALVPVSLVYNPLTRTLTWDQGLSLPSGDYTLTILGTGPNAATDRGGRALDGVFGTTLPTGNGLGGSDLVYTITVP